jgi:hypothetical protein
VSVTTHQTGPHSISLDWKATGEGKITPGTWQRIYREMWLKAPIEERDEDGTRRMNGGKGSKRGTPRAESQALCSPIST